MILKQSATELQKRTSTSTLTVMKHNTAVAAATASNAKCTHNTPQSLENKRLKETIIKKMSTFIFVKLKLTAVWRIS